MLTAATVPESSSIQVEMSARWLWEGPAGKTAALSCPAYEYSSWTPEACMSLLSRGFRLRGEVPLAQRARGSECLGLSQEGVSRGRIQISIGGALESEATTLPTELTGARRDCGCPDAQAQAQCCDNRAWASSADLGRSLAPAQSLFPLNSLPLSFYPPRTSYFGTWVQHALRHVYVHVPRRQLGADRVPDPS